MEASVKCGFCGDLFEPHGNRKKFCCYDCYYEDTCNPNLKLNIISCKECGKPFKKRVNVKTCSIECRDLSRKKYGKNYYEEFVKRKVPKSNREYVKRVPIFGQ
jgi:hypothetical protein